MQACIAIKFLDLKNKYDREYLKKQIKDLTVIFNDALKELEEKKWKKLNI